MFLIGGLIALLIGAQLTVDSAVEIALAIGIPEIVIGLSVVAVGTSLPELAGTISAARMGHKEIAVGNVIGSNIANIFLVMGVLSLINPIAVEDFVVDQTLPLLIILTIVTFGLYPDIWYITPVTATEANKIPITIMISCSFVIPGRIGAPAASSLEVLNNTAGDLLYSTPPTAPLSSRAIA